MRRGNRMLKKYRVETFSEKLDRLGMPIVCKIIGHVEMNKMHCVICRRCATVLRYR